MTAVNDIARDILRLRMAQMIINERYKQGQFKIPIHLAMGHEAIAVAVGRAMEAEDCLVLPHRNLHYNLARSPRFKPILDEFLLSGDGLAGARLGSMNLANPGDGILYSSSILGNALCVAAGVGLGLRVKESPGIVITVTGDGALEEGAFVESVTFMRTYEVSGLFIVENNGWSMSTTIAQRRCDIHLDRLASAFGADYERIEGNDPVAYVDRVRALRDAVAERRRPAILEVQLNTLGDWRADPDGRYINYHAGPAPTVELGAWPPLRDNREDPVFALLDHVDEPALRQMAEEQLAALRAEIA